MTPLSIDLTPAQRDFLCDSIGDFNSEQWRVSSAGEAGSDRRFVRIENDNGAKYVLVLWSSADHDWDRFLRIEHDLRRICPFLPQVFAHDDRHGLILEEDLGALTLCSAVRGLSHPDEIEAVYTKVVEALVSWQGVDPRISSVIDQRSMDEETFLWESDYFARYCVTDYFGREALLDSVWERQRRTLAQATAAMPQVVIHRDFQSENILLCGDSVRFVDFQGARRGPAGYDLGSLLFDPYVPALEPALVERLLALYARLCAHPFEREAFFLCSAQRLMQALGAYGNLALHKGKDWYRVYVPVALQRLGFVLEECPDCSKIGEIVKACSDSLQGV